MGAAQAVHQESDLAANFREDPGDMGDLLVGDRSWLALELGG